ncbi:restriction endonuclease subunit S [Lactobacillus helveticus]|uniref:restriction endonuclease subunit S n=1 Tax=Lactobacillus helveticus TaxID=1587 RepID=UPI00207C1C4D|nr:restriction endonuclease subunit S [Lactobacillus helveticus]MCO0807831.1 restriction endonuclease subunit S [Lactobacillus helveticus]
METKTVRLGDVANVNPRLPLTKGTVARKIPMEALTAHQRHIDSFFYEKYSGGVKFQNGDTLVARITPSLENGKTSYVDLLDKDEIAFGSTEFIVLRAKNKLILPKFLYYISISDDFRQMAIQSMTGTSGRQRVQSESVINYEFSLPDIEKQTVIVDLLDAIDQKIELNRLINKNLLKLSVLGFNKWLDSTQSNQYTSLDKIASFKNGIAMQKFSPTDKIHVLPVIKIRELNQGYIDSNSDSVTSVIDDDVKVHNGDLVFSWSGTLSAKIWTDGDAALNQHLFKVTSNRWPKWFYYLWVLHHLNTFRGIAADKKTTMGHIKRKDLTNAKVLIPNAKEFKNLDTILNPIIEQMVNGGIESKNLIDIRNILLPKLLSGSMDLSGIEEAMKNA